jgi:hypothetical protein
LFNLIIIFINFVFCLFLINHIGTLTTLTHLFVLSARNTLIAFFIVRSPRRRCMQRLYIAQSHPRVAALRALPGAIDIVSLRETDAVCFHS